MIFQDGLVHVLEEGERCETNDGYNGSVPMYAKYPGVIEGDPEKAEMQQRVRNCQETVNKRFENWAILSMSETMYLLAPPTITRITDLTEEFSVCTSGTLRRKG